MTPLTRSLLLLGSLSMAACASTPSTSSSSEIPEHHHGHVSEAPSPHHGHQPHGHMEHRFSDAEAYARRWNNPEREAWQQPQAVVDALGLQAGMTVADLGTGTGYFIPYLARAVGPQGQVIAADREQVMLDYTMAAAKADGLTQVVPHLTEDKAPAFAPASLDRILTVNVWHHLPERKAYSAKLKEALKPGGSVWVVDFHPKAPAEVGPPLQFRLAPEVVAAELEAAGLKASIHPLALDRQYLVVGVAP